MMGSIRRGLAKRILCFSLLGAAFTAQVYAADAELWWFKDDKTILSLFRNFSSVATTQKLRDSTYPFEKLPESLKLQVQSQFQDRLSSGYIMAVSEPLRKSLPKKLITQIYDELLRNHVEPEWVHYPNRREFERDLDKYGLQGEARKALAGELYRLPSRNDGYYLFLNHETISNFPEAWKSEVLNKLRARESSASTISEMTSSPEELSAQETGRKCVFSALTRFFSQLKP